MGQGLEDREFAKGQIRRMAMMKGFPREYPEAIADLVKALMIAPTEDLAREVIDGFVEDADSEKPCPFQKDIKSAVLRLMDERLGTIQADPLCPKCKGIGEVIVERGGHTGSYRCDCFARRPPIDYSKLPGVERFDPREFLADGVKKLNGGGK